MNDAGNSTPEFIIMNRRINIYLSILCVNFN